METRDLTVILFIPGDTRERNLEHLGFKTVISYQAKESRKTLGGPVRSRFSD